MPCLSSKRAAVLAGCIVAAVILLAGTLFTATYLSWSTKTSKHAAGTPTRQNMSEADSHNRLMAEEKETKDIDISELVEEQSPNDVAVVIGVTTLTRVTVRPLQPPAPVTSSSPPVLSSPSPSLLPSPSLSAPLFPTTSLPLQQSFSSSEKTHLEPLVSSTMPAEAAAVPISVTTATPKRKWYTLIKTTKAPAGELIFPLTVGGGMLSKISKSQTDPSRGLKKQGKGRGRGKETGKKRTKGRGKGKGRGGQLSSVGLHVPVVETLDELNPSATTALPTGTSTLVSTPVAGLAGSSSHSDASLSSAQRCQLWYHCTDPVLLQYRQWFNLLPSCPCTYPKDFHYAGTVWDEKTGSQIVWRAAPLTVTQMKVYHQGSSQCIQAEAPPAASSRGFMGAQTCCYDRKSRLVTRGSGAGRPSLISPSVSEELHKMLDLVPWMLCHGDWTKYNNIYPPNNDLRCKKLPGRARYLLQAWRLRKDRVDLPSISSNETGSTVVH